MTLDKFWDIIESCRAATGRDMAAFNREIASRLSAWELDELASFYWILWGDVGLYNDHELWHIVDPDREIISGEDSWEAYGGWLVAQGREYHDAVQRDPQEATRRLPTPDDIDRGEDFIFAPGWLSRVGRESCCSTTSPIPYPGAGCVGASGAGLQGVFFLADWGMWPGSSPGPTKVAATGGGRRPGEARLMPITDARIEVAEALKAEWLDRLAVLVAQVKGWAEASGWRARQVSKTVAEPGTGRYEVPVLLLERGDVEVALSPLARTGPGADGVVDLYRMPAYDDVASLDREGVRWSIRPARTRDRLPLDAFALNRVLDSVVADA
jgi:hypothetical protein